MKYLLVFLLVSGTLAGMVTAQAHAGESNETLRVQLLWKPNAEFAGSLVAKKLGYYKNVGLNVELVPGAPGIDPIERLNAGKVDVAISWLPAALQARQSGVDVVNIAQIYQKPFLSLACRKSAGIHTPADIRGKKVAIWGVGVKASLRAFLNKFHISLNQIQLVRKGVGGKALANKKVACSTAMQYNEYLTLMTKRRMANDLLLFRFSKYGVGFLENGLYVMGPRLRHDNFRDRLARFLSATAKGWKYVKAHPNEALAIILAQNPGLDRMHQRRMLEMVLESVKTEPFGLLNIGEYQRTRRMIIGGSSKSRNNETASGAGWTHRIWRQAGLDQREHSWLTHATAYYLQQTINSFWFRIFDFIGVAAFGLAGFMRAFKHRYDLFGAFVLTFIPALGGPTLRDLLIGRASPFLFDQYRYILIVVGVYLLGLFLTRILPDDITETSGFYKRLVFFDTIGLATFTIFGTEVALLYGLAWWWGPLLSAVTCAGGGLLLDLFTGNEPRTFQGELYEELGILGGLVLLGGLAIANYFPHTPELVPIAIGVTFAVVYALRILAVRYRYQSVRLGSLRQQMKSQ